MKTSPAKLWKHCVTAATTYYGYVLRPPAAMILPYFAVLKQTDAFPLRLIRISVNLHFGHANLHLPVSFCFVSALPQPGM